MKTSNRTTRPNLGRQVTTIYLVDGTPLIVEVLEWGGGTTPVLVRTVDYQVMRLGIETRWSCYPNQEIAMAFRTMRQNILKGQQWDYGGEPVDYMKAA